MTTKKIEFFADGDGNLHLAVKYDDQVVHTANLGRGAANQAKAFVNLRNDPEIEKSWGRGSLADDKIVTTKAEAYESMCYGDGMKRAFTVILGYSDGFDMPSSVDYQCYLGFANFADQVIANASLPLTARTKWR